MQNVEIRLVKKDGKLVFKEAIGGTRYKQFTESLEEGQVVNSYYSVELDDSEKTLGQLAKVHVLIKQLAKDIGYTVGEMKDLVKDESSLIVYDKGEPEYKSFKDCSKSELQTAIEACISIGKNVGSDVY